MLLSKEEHRRIVAEYEQGTLSEKALCQKYGLRSRSIIFSWRKRYFSSESEKVVPLSVEPTDIIMNPIDENRVLRETIADLQKRLTQIGH